MMRWAVFISGTGSNMTALLDEPESWNITMVVTNRKMAPGVGKARRRGVPVKFFSKDSSWLELSKELSQAGVQGLILAGFMRIVPGEFLKAWKETGGVILNLHPSLLPDHPGLDSIRRSFDSGGPMGVTVHHVVAEVDAGPIIAQRSTRRCTHLEDSELLLHFQEQRELIRGVRACIRK